MNSRPIEKVVVLGGGSAGFIAALALKVKMPELQVRVIRSKDIGAIATHGDSPLVGACRKPYTYGDPRRNLGGFRSGWGDFPLVRISVDRAKTAFNSRRFTARTLRARRKAPCSLPPVVIAPPQDARGPALRLFSALR